MVISSSTKCRAKSIVYLSAFPLIRTKANGQLVRLFFAHSFSLWQHAHASPILPNVPGAISNDRQFFTKWRNGENVSRMIFMQFWRRRLFEGGGAWNSLQLWHLNRFQYDAVAYRTFLGLFFRCHRFWRFCCSLFCCCFFRFFLCLRASPYVDWPQQIWNVVLDHFARASAFNIQPWRILKMSTEHLQ